MIIWDDQTVHFFHMIIDFRFGEGMIAHRDIINAFGDELLIDLIGDSLAMGCIFAIGDHQIDPVFLFQRI